MEKSCNEEVSINMEKSFFVGDAAGRPKDWLKGTIFNKFPPTYFTWFTRMTPNYCYDDQFY